MGQAESQTVSGSVGAVLVATAPDAGVQAADFLWRTVAGRPLITWPLRALAPIERVSVCKVIAPSEHQPDLLTIVRSRPPGGGMNISGLGTSARTWAELLDWPPSTDWVILLDATFPLVTTESLRAGLRTAAQTGVAIAGEPVKETLKRVDGTSVVETPPRESLRRLLTPIIFQREAWLRLRQSIADPAAEDPDANDLVALARRSGAPLTVYEAGYPGVRITSEADLAIIETLLSQRSPEAH